MRIQKATTRAKPMAINALASPVPNAMAPEALFFAKSPAQSMAEACTSETNARTDSSSSM